VYHPQFIFFIHTITEKLIIKEIGLSTLKIDSSSAGRSVENICGSSQRREGLISSERRRLTTVQSGQGFTILFSVWK